MHSSKRILHAACPIERCRLTAGRSYCISHAARMMSKTIWVTNEHLNLSGSVSATLQGDGHQNPKYTLSCVLMLGIVITYCYCVQPFMVLHFLSALTTDNEAAHNHFIASSHRYTISDDCLRLLFSSTYSTTSRHTTPAHQMQCYIPAPHSPTRLFDVKLTL